MDTRIASVDRAVLAHLRSLATGDQPDFFYEMVRLFLTDMDHWLATLLLAHLKQDRKLLGRAAHAIGGGAMIFGASRLVEMCGDLREIELPGFDETAARVDAIKRECAEVRRILQNELQVPSSLE